MRRRQSCFPPPRAVPSPGSSSDSAMDCFPCTGCLSLTGFPLPGQGSAAPVQMFNSVRPHLELLSALTQDVLVVLTVAQSGFGWLGSHPKNLQTSKAPCWMELELWDGNSPPLWAPVWTCFSPLQRTLVCRLSRRGAASHYRVLLASGILSELHNRIFCFLKHFLLLPLITPRFPAIL